MIQLTKEVRVYETRLDVVGWYDIVGDVIRHEGKSWAITAISSVATTLYGIPYKVATLRTHRPLPPIKRLNQNGILPKTN